MKDILEKIDEGFLLDGSDYVYEKVISYIEKILIEKALERSYGNQVMAAKILGLNRNTLHAKVKKLNIDVQRFKR
ncbi:MAG: helix-turn-helix domain-containing protein [Candidatus Omnitrophica bacterium]|nr:helix-turn-helix domain-containing protein [Candidatus Omnitrophota bacterium]HOX55128.1 helix-turn-helix domain-containing protein [Candidatus Omnitrophota bacterium]